MIKINDTVTLLNLDTNEYEYFKLVQHTEIHIPICMSGPYDSNLTKSIPTTGGGSMVDGFTIISSKSTLGKNLLNKKIGDIIRYETPSNLVITFKIICLGKYEQQYNKFQLSNSIKQNNGSQLSNSSKIKKKGLDIYYNAFEKDLIPILYLDYWSYDFCFVPEEVIYDVNNNPILIGSTFKSGKIYQNNKEYEADKYFFEYDNSDFIEKIKSQYKYQTIKKLVRTGE